MLQWKTSEHFHKFILIVANHKNDYDSSFYFFCKKKDTFIDCQGKQVNVQQDKLVNIWLVFIRLDFHILVFRFNGNTTFYILFVDITDSINTDTGSYRLRTIAGFSFSVSLQNILMMQRKDSYDSSLSSWTKSTVQLVVLSI